MRFLLRRKRSEGRPLSTLTELTALSTGGDALLSEPVVVTPFSRAVLSFNAQGRWSFDLRVRIGGTWSPWCPMGSIDGERMASAKNARFDAVSVATDTLVVRNGKTADAFQARATGTGTLPLIAVTHYRPDDALLSRTASPAWGTVLPVPERSQGVEERSIRSRICSPTSIAMVLAYHGRDLPTAQLAGLVKDTTANIYGNWPFNTAVAARLLGGWAAVSKLRGFGEVEEEIRRKRPVVISHRWEPGQLTGAPISRTDGHVIVVVGFTENGDVVVNDPAGKPGSVRRVYRREEIFQTWQKNGDGIAYLIRPA